MSEYNANHGKDNRASTTAAQGLVHVKTSCIVVLGSKKNKSNNFSPLVGSSTYREESINIVFESSPFGVPGYSGPVDASTTKIHPNRTWMIFYQFSQFCVQIFAVRIYFRLLSMMFWPVHQY